MSSASQPSDDDRHRLLSGTPPSPRGQSVASAQAQAEAQEQARGTVHGVAGSTAHTAERRDSRDRGVISWRDEEAALGETVGRQQTELYPRRFWVLFLFWWMAFLQMWVWAMWSPVRTVAEGLYGWHSALIFELFVDWNVFLMPVTLPLAPYFIDRLGVRAAITVAAGLIASGAVMRILTESAPAALYLAEAASIINALALPMAWTLPAKLSSLWFGRDERTTATAFATTSGGVAAIMTGTTGLFIHSADRLRRMLRVQAVLSCVLFALTILDHFVADPEPPLAPSQSTARVRVKRSAHGRDAASTSIRASFALTGEILKFPAVWVLGFGASLSYGVTIAWGAEVNLIMGPYGYTQDQCAWLVTMSAASSIFGSLVAGRLTDQSRYPKHVLVFLLSVAVGTMTVFAWVVYTHHDGINSVYITSCLGSMATGGTIPIFYEEVVEAIYPREPIIGNMVMSLLVGLHQAVFLVLNSFVRYDSLVVVWIIPCAIGAALLLIIFCYRPRTNSRRAIDI